MSRNNPPLFHIDADEFAGKQGTNNNVAQATAPTGRNDNSNTEGSNAADIYRHVSDEDLAMWLSGLGQHMENSNGRRRCEESFRQQELELGSLGDSLENVSDEDSALLQTLLAQYTTVSNNRRAGGRVVIENTQNGESQMLAELLEVIQGRSMYRHRQQVQEGPPSIDQGLLQATLAMIQARLMHSWNDGVAQGLGTGSTEALAATSAASQEQSETAQQNDGSPSLRAVVEEKDAELQRMTSEMTQLLEAQGNNAANDGPRQEPPPPPTGRRRRPMATRGALEDTVVHNRDHEDPEQDEDHTAAIGQEQEDDHTGNEDAVEDGTENQQQGQTDLQDRQGATGLAALTLDEMDEIARLNAIGAFPNQDVERRLPSPNQPRHAGNDPPGLHEHTDSEISHAHRPSDGDTSQAKLLLVEKDREHAKATAQKDEEIARLQQQLVGEQHEHGHNYALLTDKYQKMHKKYLEALAQATFMWNAAEHSMLHHCNEEEAKKAMECFTSYLTQAGTSYMEVWKENSIEEEPKDTDALMERTLKPLFSKYTVEVEKHFNVMESVGGTVAASDDAVSGGTLKFDT